MLKKVRTIMGHQGCTSQIPAGKITTDEEFLEDLAKHTGLGIHIANYWWFGGENPYAGPSALSDEQLDDYIFRTINYPGDPDNIKEFFQYLYDREFLSFEAIQYITTADNWPEDPVYMVVRGEGYTEPGANADMECHGLPFFCEKNGFTQKEIINIKGLFAGESLNLDRRMQAMSVVCINVNAYI